MVRAATGSLSGRASSVRVTSAASALEDDALGLMAGGEHMIVAVADGVGGEMYLTGGDGHVLDARTGSQVHTHELLELTFMPAVPTPTRVPTAVPT